MNKTAANGSRRTLINGMRAYLDAVDATMKRGSERAVVRCDADAYALILIKLAQEQLRSVVSLMGETRPNFVGAAACARSAFELGVRGLWMCKPEDPQERMRRVAILDMGTAHEQLQQLVDRAQPAAQDSRLGGFLAAMASVGDLSATQPFQG